MSVYVYLPGSTQELIDILDVKAVNDSLFRGFHPEGSKGRVFGGQVVAQALAAAYKANNNNMICHSLHGYFLLGGDPSLPIDFQVEGLRQGRSFANYSVKAIQRKKIIFQLMCSFHKGETGLETFIPMKAIPHPDQLPTISEQVALYKDKLSDIAANFLLKTRPIEIRPVDLNRYISGQYNEAEFNMWFRTSEFLETNLQQDHAILAYASDFALLGTAMMPHSKTLFDKDIMPASLDHTIWFHRPFKVGEWLLYSQDSPSTHSARALSRGAIYTESGILVASIAQEGLVRVINKP